MKKVASLNLSVNAIVVFVLAFAMLGVGLMFTGIIREKMVESTKGIVPKDDFKNPPSASDPITISNDVTLKRGAKKNIDLGFYNDGSGTANDVKLGVRECLNDQGDKLSEVPNVVSPASSVPASDWKAFKIILDMGSSDEVESTYSAGTYVCTFSAYRSGASPDPEITSVSSSGYIYQEKQIFLTITS
ncbi:MAG: hypothetical protein ACQESF_05005 [Nanobdellota archaeon]